MIRKTITRIFKLLFTLLFVNGLYSKGGNNNFMWQEYQKQPLNQFSRSIFPPLGNARAKVVMNYFFDTLCPDYREFAKIVQNVLKDPHYKDKIVIYKHLLLLGEDHFENDQNVGLLDIEMVKRNLYDSYHDILLNQDIYDFTQMLQVASQLAKQDITKEVIQRNIKEIKNKTISEI
jgi:protein-disulfide isomerase